VRPDQMVKIHASDNGSRSLAEILRADSKAGQQE
jgi:hypothetical protein